LAVNRNKKLATFVIEFSLFLNNKYKKIIAMTEKQDKATKKDAIYITIILLILAGSGYFGFQMGKLKNQLKSCGDDTTALSLEKDELNSIIQNSGIVDNANGEEVKNNLIELLGEYDNLENNNLELNDSITNQKNKINGLLLKIDSINNLSAAEKKKAYGTIYKLKKETETLREIMKGYIHTIDSLNTLNIGLQNTIVKKDEQITSINQDLTSVQDQKKNLEQTVKLGSVLQTTDFLVEAIKVRNSGAETETNRANRAEQFKACFVVLENKIAKAENKTFYLRILEPSSAELVGENPVFFAMGDRDGQACRAREINYQNANVDVCIYYELEKEVAEGTYIVELYCEGHKVGATSFALK
jgi:hypothetical protein